MMKHPVLLSCLTVLSSLGYAAAVHAASNAPPPTQSAPEAQATAGSSAQPEARHHRGFYLRTHLGGGYRRASTTVNQQDYRVSGGGVGFGTAVGGAVATDLIVYGEVLCDVASSPTIATPSGSTQVDGSTQTFFAMGPGISYYIMPANVHVGVSALLTKLSLDVNATTTATTAWGFGGAARIGKDFWLGQKLGLGVMGQFTMATMKDSQPVDGKTPNWTSTAATLALEMTYQ